jgi:pimeloyl-ACP methyl ester carboxylesterase
MVDDRALGARDSVVESGGVSLAVRDHGGGRGPALLLLHGSGDTLAAWDEVASLLTSELRDADVGWIGSRRPLSSHRRRGAYGRLRPAYHESLLLWQLPSVESFLRRLGEAARVVVFDPRGTGLSDRGRDVALESRMDDVSAVLDAIGCARALIFGAVGKGRCRTPPQGFRS